MGDVRALPIFNLDSVVAGLRQLANRIEAGELTATRAVVVYADDAGVVSYSAFGPAPFPRWHALGLLAAGSAMIGDKLEDA